MTRRMYNKVKRTAKMGENHTTFDTLCNKLEEKVDISGMTSKQIAGVIDVMYQQKEYGATEMWKELQ